MAGIQRNYCGYLIRCIKIPFISEVDHAPDRGDAFVYADERLRKKTSSAEPFCITGV